MKFYLAGCGALAALLLALGVFLARGPDREVEFTRDVPLEATPQALQLALGHLSQWPLWFFHLQKADRVDGFDHPLPLAEQEPAAGGRIHLRFDPRKRPHGGFDFTGEITRYVPGKLLEIRIDRDSTGRLTRLFDRILWRIEVEPAQGTASGSIRDTEIARTRHWRARLLSRLSERVLMNQAFYPDLLALAGLKPPQDPNSGPGMSH